MMNLTHRRSMENQLAIRSSIPTEHEMAVYHTMARQAIDSKMYASNFKDQSGVMMIMLAARELGIPPMQALNGGINIIQGKVEISARMMNAMIRRAGHRIEIKESSENACILIGKRADTGEQLTTSFSLAEAQKAGLVKPGSGWTKWPKDMCFARALSRLARQLFSDVIGIGYVEGEIKASDAEIVACQEEPFQAEVNEDPTPFRVNYLVLFDQEERELAKEYLSVVQDHFGWHYTETLKNLLQDEEKLLEKFNGWKKANNK